MLFVRGMLFTATVAILIKGPAVSWRCILKFYVTATASISDPYDASWRWVCWRRNIVRYWARLYWHGKGVRCWRLTIHKSESLASLTHSCTPLLPLWVMYDPSRSCSQRTGYEDLSRRVDGSESMSTKWVCISTQACEDHQIPRTIRQTPQPDDLDPRLLSIHTLCNIHYDPS